MKTKAVPAIVMLLAGAVTCILGIIYQYETMNFIVMLLIVLIVFYLLGGIVKIILDKNFSQEKKKPEEQEELSEEEENIESESDENKNK